MSAPDLEDVKAWLGLTPEDTEDDVVLQESLNAALAALARIVTLPKDDFGEDLYPDELREAALLWTQRLAARRNSPEGVVGLSGTGGDFVGARVPSNDPDIMRLIGPYLKLVVS